MSELETFDLYTTDPVKLIEIYQKILKSNGILDPISQVTVEDPSLRGEGFGSYRRNVTVEFENKKLEPLQLFAKLQVNDNPNHLELTNEMRCFEKESIFLTKYVAEAKAICKRKGLDESLVTNIYPKCYYADNQGLIMENLKVGQGYVILGKDEPHDWDTATFALKILAHHHAISYAVIQEAGGPEIFFQRYPVFKHEAIDKPLWAAKLEPWLQSNVNTNIKILQMNTQVEGSAEAMSTLQKLQQKCSSLCELCVTSVQIDPDDLLLLGHGDYWYANMLFLKDPTTNKIIGEKAVDFQNLRYNSPAIDLPYYLFLSANTEIRQRRLNDLLQSYLTNLRQVSADLGHPIELSLDKLLSQYRKKLHLGFILSFMGRYGPSRIIMASVDMAEVEGDWGEFVDKAAKEWIVKNKKEAETMAKELVSVMKEYRDLVQ